MQVRVEKWGDGLAFRIPESFARAANLSEGPIIELTLADGGARAIPTANQEYSLEQLLAGVTENNIHREVVFRRP